ncbi:MAG: hypothetical protein ACTSWN_17080 [Promethearchaeota archaeon]
MNIQISLTPSESKRLIAKGVLEILKEEIESNHQILITRGSTNAYILDEICKYLGVEKQYKLADFITGQILAGDNALIANTKRIPEILIKGKSIQEVDPGENIKIARKMKKGDIIIKGANALDPDGLTGILVGNQSTGGTIGTLYGVIVAKGIRLLIPVGLEKLVASPLSLVRDFSGAMNCKFAQGMPCGLFIVEGRTFTELEAIQCLFDVNVLHMASGGLGDAQGSVVLLVISDDEEELIACKKFLKEEIFGEKRLEPNLPV